MDRWLTFALVGITLASAALMLGATPQLPDRVAAHFDWNGHPNGWMDRDSYLLFMLGFGVALPWFTYAIILLQRRVRNADYWFAPPRRDATVRSIRAFAAVTALAIALLVATIHVAIVAAHESQPVRLDNMTLVTTLALFAAAMIGLAIANSRRFRRPRDGSLRA